MHFAFVLSTTPVKLFATTELIAQELDQLVEEGEVKAFSSSASCVEELLSFLLPDPCIVLFRTMKFRRHFE